MTGHARNLQGYCDYTACRKFNHRYLSSDGGKEQDKIFLVHSGLGSPQWDVAEMNTSGEYPTISGDGFSTYTDGKLSCVLLCYARVSHSELGDDTSEEHIREIALPRILKEYTKIKKARSIKIKFQKDSSSVLIQAIDAVLTNATVNTFTITIGRKILRPKDEGFFKNPDAVYFSGEFDIKSEVTLKATPTRADLVVQEYVTGIDVWCVVSEVIPVTSQITLTLEATDRKSWEEYFLEMPSLQPLWTSFITSQRYVITFYNKLIL